MQERGARSWWPCGKASFLTCSGEEALEKPSQRAMKHRRKEKWLGFSGKAWVLIGTYVLKSHVHSRGLIFVCFLSRGPEISDDG